MKAKGLTEEEPRGLTYSGPAEDGSRLVKRSATTDSDDKDGLSRRERREAARQQTKPAARAPKSKRRR